MKLRRTLGFWALFCVASGAMISSGLFVLPGQAFAFVGPAAVLAYALAALMVVPAMLSKAELASAMPKSGGSYFYVQRSMGALPGTLAGLSGWLSMVGTALGGRCRASRAAKLSMSVVVGMTSNRTWLLLRTV
ncbi:hypothetical protein LCGC14_2486070 [marine sediment metagenome]|uniref:Amino acid permease/ SLC12A domain-containing protein n=1 Tax=marine sediment metagenome TaxID=412755 RepID=A0A0F9DZU1_9ZZZZ